MSSNWFDILPFKNYITEMYVYAFNREHFSNLFVLSNDNIFKQHKT